MCVWWSPCPFICVMAGHQSILIENWFKIRFPYLPLHWRPQLPFVPRGLKCLSEYSLTLVDYIKAEQTLKWLLDYSWNHLRRYSTWKRVPLECVGWRWHEVQSCRCLTVHFHLVCVCLIHDFLTKCIILIPSCVSSVRFGKLPPMYRELYAHPTPPRNPPALERFSSLCQNIWGKYP